MEDKKRIAKYVEEGGQACPFCGSHFLDRGTTVTYGTGREDETYQKTWCRSCASEWDEILDCDDLVDIRVIRRGREVIPEEVSE